MSDQQPFAIMNYQDYLVLPTVRKSLSESFDILKKR